MDAKYPEIKKGKGRPDISKYKNKLSKENLKILSKLVYAYDTLHLAMGYDGNLSYNLAQEGIKNAIDIIDWATENNVD